MKTLEDVKMNEVEQRLKPYFGENIFGGVEIKVSEVLGTIEIEVCHDVGCLTLCCGKNENYIKKVLRKACFCNFPLSEKGCKALRNYIEPEKEELEQIEDNLEEMERVYNIE